MTKQLRKMASDTENNTILRENPALFEQNQRAGKQFLNKGLSSEARNNNEPLSFEILH